MFVDCDFLFLQDVTELFREAERGIREKPCAVVKHDYTPKNSVKMDNMHQATYNYKLWSSLMFFNLSHPDMANLSVENVNTKPGSWLHQFEWVKDKSTIASLDERWNFIPEHSHTRVPLYDIGAVHYTEGSPVFKHMEDCPMADLFYQFKNDYDYEKFLEASKNVSVFPRQHPYGK